MLVACHQSKWSFILPSFQIVMIVSCRLLGADLGNDRPWTQYRWVPRADTVGAFYIVNGRLKLHLNVVTLYYPHKILIEHMTRGILDSVQ